MSEYTDLKGNRHEVKNTVLISSEEKTQIEEEIVEKLYEIFTSE